MDATERARLRAESEERLDERWSCSEFAEKWLREVDEITQDTPADLAAAIRDAAWTAGAEAMREAILDELPCVSAERDECAARMHRVAIPAPPCPEVSR